MNVMKSLANFDIQEIFFCNIVAIISNLNFLSTKMCWITYPWLQVYAFSENGAFFLVPHVVPNRVIVLLFSSYQQDVLDPPEDCFRIRMVITLLETCGHYFDRGSSRRKLDRFLIHFQRYTLGKGVLPLDIEFDLQVCLSDFVVCTRFWQIFSGCWLVKSYTNLMERCYLFVKIVQSFEYLTSEIAVADLLVLLKP